MFKYNELSDLVDGSRVTPLSKTDNGSIRCLDSNGKECFHTFDEFDFDKLPSERVEKKPDPIPEPEPEVVEPDPIPEPEPEVPNPDLTYQDMLDEMERDDSLFDGSDGVTAPIDPNEPDEPGEVEEEFEGFCDDVEADKIISAAGLTKVPGARRLVWKDIV